MTTEEEHSALDNAWKKIQEYVRGLVRFSETVKIRFPHHVYHWTMLEIYPSGDCAILTGSHGNPGEWRPLMIHGDEEFQFGLGDNEQSWYSKESDFQLIRRCMTGNPRYVKKYTHYHLLRELVDNWPYVKGLIVGEVEKVKRLENFEA